MNKSKDIAWEAQEYIPHDKNAVWYMMLIIIGLGLCALGVWMKWWSFVALIAVSVLALIVYSVRPPRMVKYVLSGKGLNEGGKIHNFENFKSFGVIDDDGHFAIVLTPRKRLSPRVWVYFPEAQGEQIVDAFGARLTMETVRLDVLDKLVRALRI